MKDKELKKLALIKQMLESAQASLQTATQELKELSGDKLTPSYLEKAKSVGKKEETPMGKIIEGIFDGQNMVGPDGKKYSIPANYASKSKLVEGDTLKLTIKDDGSFVYKQIGPVERKRMMGILTKEETSEEFQVVADGKSYKVLLASVTYFKGEVGDEVVILVPESGESEWAAVENIIKKEGGTENTDLEIPSESPKEKIEDI